VRYDTGAPFKGTYLIGTPTRSPGRDASKDQ
jgi:hypothetical protein